MAHCPKNISKNAILIHVSLQTHKHNGTPLLSFCVCSVQMMSVRHIPCLFWRERNTNLTATNYAFPSLCIIEVVNNNPFLQLLNMEQRMKELEASEPTGDGKMLRLSVETGGCSGFPYVFNLDDRINSDDRVFERGGIKLVVDNISYDFVKGATVDYVEELIRSALVVTKTPVLLVVAVVKFPSW